MVNSATLAPAQKAPSDKDAKTVLTVPFVRSAVEHVEPFMDISTLISGNTVALQPADVPAYGFLRGIFIEVTASGGTGAAAVYKADAPFTAITDVQLADVNGAPIVGPFDGYDLFVINKYGGYRRPGQNPKLQPDYTVPTTGNFSFLTYLPVEVNGRDGLGALANTNAASSYKFRCSIALKGNVFSIDPTGLPTIRVRAWLDAWSQPAPTDLQGRPQQQEPPAHGTTSYWSKQVFAIVSGQNTIRTTRVGNLIRNLIFINRDGSNVRNKTNFPASFQTYWDTRLLKDYSPIVWRGQMAQRFGLSAADDAAAGLDTGVYVDDYCHEFDGRAGYEMRDGWLPTIPATRLEWQGQFGAVGALTVLTNDVSPIGEGVFV